MLFLDFFEGGTFFQEEEVDTHWNEYVGFQYFWQYSAFLLAVIVTYHTVYASALFY